MIFQLRCEKFLSCYIDLIKILCNRILGCWVCVSVSGKLNSCCLFCHLDKIELIIFKMWAESFENHTKNSGYLLFLTVSSLLNNKYYYIYILKSTNKNVVLQDFYCLSILGYTSVFYAGIMTISFLIIQYLM